MKTTLIKTLLLLSFVFSIGMAKAQPLIMNCPADQYVSCTDELWDLSSYANATYTINGCTYNAGVPVVTYNLNPCNTGTITRTWTVCSCGCTASCTQTFYVSGSSLSYSDIVWPLSHLELTGCNPDTSPDALPAGYGAPTYSVDTECSMMGVNYNDQIFTISSTCKKLIRTWQLCDYCNFDETTGYGFYTYNQIIILIDGDIPNPVVQDEVVEFTQNCTNAYVNVPMIWVDATSCGGSYTITNNSPYAVDNGPDASGTYPIGITTIKYTVNYGCGYKKYFDVRVVVKDNKNPTPYCLATLNVALMGIDNDGDGINDEGMVDVNVCNLDQGSYHSCPSHYPISLSFSSDPTDKVKTFTCDEVGENTVEMWVTDRFGNQDFCLVNIIVQNNAANIVNCQPQEEITSVSAAGFILSGVGESLIDTEVEITKVSPQPLNTEDDEGGEDDDYSAKHMTDRYGFYKFEELPMHQDYQLSCKKDINMHDYVTKEDVRALYQHITGRAILTDPYLLVAADLNDDQVIDRTDLYAMYYFAHGINSSLGIDKTHIFISNHTPLVNTDDYYNNNISSKIILRDVEQNMHEIGFRMLVKGDLYSPRVQSHLRDGKININVDDNEILNYLNSEETSFSINPNPFSETINITLDQIIETNVTVSLFDVQGRKIFENTQKASNSLEVSMDTKIDAGVYYYQVIYNEQIHTGKIIKI